MTQQFLEGEDGRLYIITSDTDIANKVEKITEKYIFVGVDTYTNEDNLVVKLKEPEPLSVVPLKDIILIGELK